MGKQKDLLNKRFYKLLIYDKVEVYRGKYIWKCRCDCGKEFQVQGSDILKGYKKSCGCWRKPSPPGPSVQERFWKFVQKTETCWNWIGSCSYYGYGQISFKGKPLRSHRVSYELHKGIIPKGMEVCHKCDNPKCVNPDHLFLGTQKDNVRDMHKKNRANICKGENKPACKLNEEDVKNIRKLYKNPYSSNELSLLFQVCKQNILDIINRKAWKHVA